MSSFSHILEWLFLNFFFFLLVLGLRCYAQAFSSCVEQGLLFFAMCGFLIVGASLVAEHRLSGTWASVVVALRL